MIYKLLLTFFVVLSTTLSASAAEFIAFEHRGVRGYVEVDAYGRATVNVLPSLEISAEDGLRQNDDRTITLRPQLVPGLKKAGLLESQFVEEVLNKTGHGNAINKKKPLFNTPFTSSVSSQWVVAGLVVAENHPSHVEARQGTPRLRALTYGGEDQEAVQSIWAGNFDLEVTYYFPFRTFSSLVADFEADAITNATVQSFQNQIKRHEKSGFKFLFVDFSSETLDLLVESSRDAKVNQSFTSSARVTMVDPTEAMMKRVERMLNANEIDEREFRDRHRAAADRHTNNGNKKLAELHQQYLAAVEAKDTGRQVDILKAVAALGKKDIAGFLASGVSFGFSDAEGRSEIRSIETVALTAKRKQELREFIISESHVAFLAVYGPFDQVGAALILDNARRFAGLTPAALRNRVDVRYGGRPLTDIAQEALNSVAINHLLTGKADPLREMLSAGAIQADFLVPVPRFDGIPNGFNKDPRIAPPKPALWAATRLAKWEVALVLTEAGADPNVFTSPMLVSLEGDPQALKRDPLYYAVQGNRYELVRALIKAGATRERQYREPKFGQGKELKVVGWTELSIEDVARTSREREKLIQALHEVPNIEEDATVEQNDRAGRNREANERQAILASELLTAVVDGDVEIVNALLDAGVDPNVCVTDEDEKEFPLEAAVQDRNAEMIHLLLKHGAKTNVKGRSTPLLIAVEYEWDEGVDILLEAGADPLFADSDGTQPIKYTDDDEIRKKLVLAIAKSTKRPKPD